MVLKLTNVCKLMGCTSLYLERCSTSMHVHTPVRRCAPGASTECDGRHCDRPDDSAVPQLGAALRLGIEPTGPGNNLSLETHVL